MDPAQLRVIATGDGTHAAVADASLPRPRLGDILQRKGLIDGEALEAALSLHRSADIRLGEALLAAGAVNQSALISALEEQWGARYIDLRTMPPDARLVSQMGAVRCLTLGAVPWRRIGAATVVATETPSEFHAIKADLETILGPVMMALTGPGEVGTAVAQTQKELLVHRAEARVSSGLSCRDWQAEPFRIFAMLIGSLLVLTTALSVPYLCTALIALSCLFLLVLTGIKLAAIIAQAWPQRKSADIFELHGDARPDRLPIISVLVPLFQEERIALQLTKRLEALDYPHALLDVCFVVEEEDWVTRTTLARVKLPFWMRVLIVPAGNVKTKPRALNYALDFCRGSIVGVYDAEDAPEPDQLRKVAKRFAAAGPKVACLQGSLDFYNTKLNWFARCFTLEYASWFRVMLPGIARLGLVVPLGGTTLFFRRKALEELGAWDAHNVTEDADLGLRLARAGYRTEIVEITTWEEANAHAWPWVKQRSRWLKGYAMTYAVHMRQPVRLWHDLGAWRFLGVQAMFLGALIQFALAPLLWSLWVIPFGLWHPVREVLPPAALSITAGFFAFSELIIAVMAVRALQRTGRLHLTGWVLTMPAYFLLATVSMYKALYEMYDRPFYWDKTQHGKFGGATKERSG